MLSVDELTDRLIDLSFAEDIGDGDHTTLCCIPADAVGKSRLIIKEDGILAGVEVAKEVFRRFDSTLQVEVLIGDGSPVKVGDIAMIVTGKVQSLLQTTPGMRMLEKEAVKIGGGTNHRIGLFDMILLKDNHVDFAGGIHNAISRAKEYCKKNGKNLKIEIEVRNFKELEEALLEKPDRIMFDNFTPEDTVKAVQIVNHQCETESSGGITFDNMIPYAKAGVDFISFGALTHSVKGLDMSFKAV